ncbi:MAG: hypothetical protein QOH31_351, partial [Verrucomicrobiota bacterium]
RIRSTTIQPMSLQRSLIAHDHRPILDRLPSRIRFATGTRGWSRGPLRVKTGKARYEHMFSALPLKADMTLRTRYVRFGPRTDSCAATKRSAWPPSSAREFRCSILPEPTSGTWGTLPLAAASLYFRRISRECVFSQRMKHHELAKPD